jgi:type II secretory ATPase GspE/PulE/Tfp pilus assembly ATPase PilB-like protein
VFTTVHANNVLDVLGRFLNMGVEPPALSALNCILAQRLVRVICELPQARGGSRIGTGGIGRPSGMEPHHLIQKRRLF